MVKLKVKQNLQKLVNIKKKEYNINYINVLFIFIIIIIIVLQIRKPFITNSIKNLNDNINSYLKMKNDVNNAKVDIADIEEDSLIRINNIKGGIDEINNNDELNRPNFMLQSNNLGSSILKDEFENTELNDENMTLKLFFQNGCLYSESFLPLWNQIKEVLPNYIKTEEINCSRKDILGFSLCKKYLVNEVPTIILIKSDNNNNTHIKYTGINDYLSIKQWLNSHNISLSYNPEIEHFDKTGGFVSSDNTTTNNNDTFTDLKSGIAGGNFGGTVLSANGDLRSPYDKMYKDASKMNEFGEFDDVDEDGCPIAYFSKCKENSVNPGYQVFTHRGQWGCTYPDKYTSINNDFDTAFSTVDNYLQSLPPKMEKITLEDGSISLKVSDYSASEKIAKMKKCAFKYKDEIRNFGLCDNNKLNDKYTIKENIENGELNLPFNDMDINHYNDTKDTAEALYTACSR